MGRSNLLHSPCFLLHQPVNLYISWARKHGWWSRKYGWRTRKRGGWSRLGCPLLGQIRSRMEGYNTNHLPLYLCKFEKQYSEIHSWYEVASQLQDGYVYTVNKTVFSTCQSQFLWVIQAMYASQNFDIFLMHTS